ncbi:MAG: hypothetical protein U0527_01420 [Candidatus Eisenbacteria bacterium]
MQSEGSNSAERLGAFSAYAIAVLSLLYAIALAIGLATLPSPSEPIHDPWFTIMELLILAIAPAMVLFSVALHERAAVGRRGFTLGAVAFLAMCAALTSVVHFAVLTLSRRPEFQAEPWASRVLSFRWPSVAYALDILAWDLFFPIGALLAALSIEGAGRSALVRRLLYLSAALSFAGLAGVPLADMNVRNIGIVGYAVIFPIAASVMARVFREHGSALVRPSR